MRQTRRIILALLLSAIVGTGAFYGFKASSEKPSSCPGRIICPVTGKVICRDLCPLKR